MATLGADSADSIAASSTVAADGADGCEGVTAEEGSACSPLGVASVLFVCVVSLWASGAVRDVLLLAWCCALMVRPGGNVDQLVSNVADGDI